MQASAGIGLVDSHAHLDMPEFDSDREDVVRRALAAGVTAVLCPADLVQPRSLAVLQDLQTQFPESILAAAGVHAHQANDFNEKHVRSLHEWASRGVIRAVGEIGLDYHYDFSPRVQQQEVLRSQLACAGELGLPVILHSRLSGPDIIAAVDAEGFRGGGILHCFTEDWAMARAMMDRGFFISFSGILTFPKAQDIRDVAKKVPADRLLVETDSPYLTPVPQRGSVRRNEPAFVVETAQVLAGLKDLSYSDLAEATTRNFRTLFR